MAKKRQSSRTIGELSKQTAEAWGRIMAKVPTRDRAVIMEDSLFVEGRINEAARLLQRLDEMRDRAEADGPGSEWVVSFVDELLPRDPEEEEAPPAPTGRGKK